MKAEAATSDKPSLCLSVHVCWSWQRHCLPGSPCAVHRCRHFVGVIPVPSSFASLRWLQAILQRVRAVTGVTGPVETYRANGALAEEAGDPSFDLTSVTATRTFVLCSSVAHPVNVPTAEIFADMPYVLLTQ